VLAVLEIRRYVRSGNVFEIIEMNWTGLARSLQPGIMGSIGGLLAILVAWLVIRFGARRASASLTHAQLCKWSNRGATLLAIAIVAGMLWQVFLVASANRPPRQDADGSPVYERMDAVIRK
jgi:hypothetical protein